MRLSDYVRESGRSVNDIHCSSGVRYATVLALSKNEVLLTRVEVAQRLVEACEGQVGLEDVLKPDVLAAVNSTNNNDREQRPKPARRKRSA